MGRRAAFGPGARPARILSAREGYAAWAPNYPPYAHNQLMEVEQNAVVPLLQIAAPRRALDAGTGTGRYLPMLVAAGARFVVGLDLSLAMLTRERGSGRRVCGDACRLPFNDATFDLVCASLMVGDLKDVGGWTREATRVLRPGGHLVYSDFHPSWVSERWRRTFRAIDGREYELTYFPHQIGDHLEQLSLSSMQVRTVREPKIVGVSAPVVVVFHAVRSGA